MMRGRTSVLSMASSAWPTASTALYLPLYLPWPYTVNRVFWGNGSVLTSTKDFGIYSPAGAKIFSTGTISESGASAIQYQAITAVLLPPGRYYMGLVCAATTNHAWSQSVTDAAHSRLAGVLQQASASPLPDTTTFATSTATILPLCGITRTTTGF